MQAIALLYPSLVGGGGGGAGGAIQASGNASNESQLLCSMTTKEIAKRMLTLEAVLPLRQKLQHLLNHSALYDVDKVTVRLSGTELYEEQIIAAEKVSLV